jgi:uncharacterized protein YtpQ (UPF0354 family)
MSSLRLAPVRQTDPSLIVPVIKRKVHSLDDAIMLSPEDSFIDGDLAGDIFILYAFDLPGHFQYVAQRDCERLGLAPGELRKLAVRNLTRLRRKPEVVQVGSSAAMLKLDGDLEASLLLVDHLWPQLARRLPGELVVAVPSRDVLVMSGTQVSGGIEALRRGVKRVWESPKVNRKLLLTRSLLIRAGDSWQALEPGPELPTPPEG